MRISDWSSDLCSSDLRFHLRPAREPRNRRQQLRDRGASRDHLLREPRPDPFLSRDHAARRDRKSVVLGKRASVRVDLGGRRIITKTKNKYNQATHKSNTTLTST